MHREQSQHKPLSVVSGGRWMDTAGFQRDPMMDGWDEK